MIGRPLLEAGRRAGFEVGDDAIADAIRLCI
jgi:hypothetical protein